MSTNADILKLNADGTLDCAVDWMDGDLSVTGRRLIEWYQEPSEAARLVRAGSFSEVISPDKLTGVLADQHEQPLHFRNWREYATSGEPREYDYVYSEGTWYVAGSYRTMDEKHWTQHVAGPKAWLSVESVIACKQAVVKHTKADYRRNGRTALLKLYLKVDRLGRGLPTLEKAKQARKLIRAYEKRFLMVGEEYVVDGPVRDAFDDYGCDHHVTGFLAKLRPVCLAIIHND